MWEAAMARVAATLLPFIAVKVYCPNGCIYETRSRIKTQVQLEEYGLEWLRTHKCIRGIMINKTWDIEIAFAGSTEIEGLLGDGWEPFASAIVPSPHTTLIGGTESFAAIITLRKQTPTLMTELASLGVDGAL